MAGSPETLPSTRQTPSPGSGLPASDASRGGGANDAAALLCLAAFGVGTVPPLGPVSSKDGFPPTFGGW